MEAYAARRLPGVVPAVTSAETCLYSLTPDEDFILDRDGDVVVGAGFSGHGFKFAPLIGEVLADLATGGGSRPAVRAVLARTRGARRARSRMRHAELEVGWPPG